MAIFNSYVKLPEGKPSYSILFRLSIKAIVSHTQINAKPTWRFPKVRAPPNHHQLDIIRSFQYWNPWIWGSSIWKNRQTSNHFRPISRIFTIFPPFFYNLSPFFHPFATPTHRARPCTMPRPRPPQLPPAAPWWTRCNVQRQRCIASWGPWRFPAGFPNGFAEVCTESHES